MKTTLETSMVGIYGIGSDIVGAGLLVSKRYVFTISNVIMKALGIYPEKINAENMPEQPIYINFPLLRPKKRIIARVVFWRPSKYPSSYNNKKGEEDIDDIDDIYDIAVLELKSPLPNQARPARLVVAEDVWGHPFRTFGFVVMQLLGFNNYEVGMFRRIFKGMWIFGVLRGSLVLGDVQIEITNKVEEGWKCCIGAPIWDEKLKGVIGMLVAIQADYNLGIMIPTTQLIKAWPTLAKEGNVHYVGLRQLQKQLIGFFVWIRQLALPRHQVKQLEQDAQQLENCKDIQSIRNAHRSLITDELDVPASPLLHSLSRITQDVNAALNQESSYNQRLALMGIADRLNGLSLELNRSSDRYAKRFRPIVNSWREILTNHVRELAKTAELHQDIDSPYIIGVPLTEQQAIFIGRTDITAQIEQLLLDQRRPPLLLYGQRRMGKTSLLYNLGRLLPNTIVPLFVDLQGPATRATDHAGLLYNIARKMVDLAKRQRGITLLPLTRDALKADPFTRFDEWLDDVELALEKNTVLLALDEFEALDRAIAKGRFEEEDVLGMLRNLIQHRPRFKVLLAGSHTLEEFQRWASYLINVQVIHISYLKEAEARQLIEQPVKDFALRYEPEALQRVLELTRCHPFLVQLLCAEIVALKNEQTPTVRRLAKLSDVEAAIPEALERGSFFFADIETNQIDAAGLEVLCFLAAEGEGSIVSREALSCKFPNELDSTLNLLLRRELIEKEDEGYRFQVELIRRWFALAQKT
ncbi:AAA family ATPase [Moorena producens]|uniref:nSTAND1 domain-containing NTPase n=1 Tax=Moorena producens TaxID=1155739 RepID=UPI000ABBF218|nr:ATP-binding protein [Moorena producens]